MEKYQHGRPHPYIIQGSQNAPPPSYDQVYGGGYGPQIIPHNKVHSSVQYHNPSCPSTACPSRMSALNISYQPQMITSHVPVHNHNGISNGNSIYYPDPRRLVTSSKLPQSTSLNNLNHNINRQDSDESNVHRTVRNEKQSTYLLKLIIKSVSNNIINKEFDYLVFQCCSFEKATKIIGITCLVLSLIGLANNIIFWCGSKCGSLGVGVYMLIEYGLNIGVHCILLQGVKKKSE